MKEFFRIILLHLFLIKILEKAGEELRIRLAPGGGWTAKLTQ
jgi:hypothetical protein